MIWKTDLLPFPDVRAPREWSTGEFQMDGWTWWHYHRDIFRRIHAWNTIDMEIRGHTIATFNRYNEYG